MFRKRTDTLFKKAKELHENTGAEVYVLFRDKNATTWADDSHHGFDGCAFGDEAPGNIKQVLDQVHGNGRRPRKRGPKKGARAARSLAESYSPQGQHSDFVDADEQLFYDLAEEDDPMPDPMLDSIPDTTPDTIQVATSGALPEVRTEALSRSALPAEAMQYDVSDADQNVTVDCNAQEAALLAGLTGVDSVPDVLLDQDRPYADAPHDFEIGPLGGFANVVQSFESPQLYGAPSAVAPQDSQFVACESFSDLFPPDDDQLDYSTLLFSSTDEFSDFLTGDQYSSVQRETHQSDRLTEGPWREEMSRPLSAVPSGYGPDFVFAMENLLASAPYGEKMRDEASAAVAISLDDLGHASFKGLAGDSNILHVSQKHARHSAFAALAQERVLFFQRLQQSPSPTFQCLFGLLQGVDRIVQGILHAANRSSSLSIVKKRAKSLGVVQQL
ncbi:SRF-type transcription factor (DNA-binding and dimerization domain) domain-containing protein [Cordyceps javanica]|nr:SRF-type transcription factor (DNA-binding and dimerization domain) domain-containing protein [Cordyceps javanica]